MACNWVKNNKGEIVGALNPQGQKSQLFEELKNSFGLEKASEMYAVAYSDDFQDLYVGEPTKQQLLRFITAENGDITLTNEHKVDLQNFMLSVGEKNPQKIIDLFIDENGLFNISAKKLKQSGYYSDYEILKITDDIELQDKIKTAVEALKNTSEDINYIEYSNTLVKQGEINSFGKVNTLNPFELEQKAIQELGGLSEEDFYMALEDFPNKNLKWEDYKDYVVAEVMQERDGELVVKPKTDTLTLIEQTAKIPTDVDFIDSLYTSNITEEYEQSVLDNLGIDITGFKDKLFDASFIEALHAFAISPNKTNTGKLAVEYDRVFEVDNSPKKEKIKANKELTGYVKITNTTKTEQELFTKNNLIKVSDDTYIKVTPKPLEELYQIVGTHFKEIKDLKKYIQDKAVKSEEIELYKMYFGITKVNEKGELLAPNGKPSNLTREQYELVRTPEFKSWFGDFENDPQNASKVVDENGEPLVVWHGTNAKFYEFQNKTGIRGNQFTGSREVKSDTFFFTDDLEYANKASNIRKENFGGSTNIVSSFLNIRQPLDFSTFDYQTEEKFNEITGEYPSQYFGYNDNLDQWWRLFDKDEDDVTNIVKEKGYGGVILAEEVKTIKDKNNYDIETASVKSFGVFNPNQIKSATEIKGTLSTDTNDIRFLKTSVKKGENFDKLDDFISDFHTEMVKERNKNSEKWKNYYSNFEINESGITLKSTDPLTLEKVSLYADENMKSYSLVSKQIPTLKNIETDITQRDEYYNFPENLKETKVKELSKIDQENIILKNQEEQFIRIDQDVYELQEVLGNLSLYNKIGRNTDTHLKFGIEKTESKFKLRDYIHLNEQTENFTKEKKYLSKEEKDNLDCR